MSDGPFVPVIPESAPFAPAQRAWLNGFLAGLYSQAPVSPQVNPAGRDVVVLYASQTGTAERLARKLAKDLKLKGHKAQVASLEDYAHELLAKVPYALIIASTYGEGDPPDSARAFFEALAAAGAPRLEGLQYSVLALGDTHYEHFCKFGLDLDQRLAALGARPLGEVFTSDVEVDEPFGAWKTDLLQRLSASSDAPAKTTVRAKAPLAPVGKFHRDHPFSAPLLEKRLLTHNISSKQTLHLSFSLHDSDLHYEAGDALAVLPSNNPELVAEILMHAALCGAETVEVAKAGPMPLADALGHHLQITRLSRRLIEAYATSGNCDRMLGLLKPEQQTHLDQYMHGRGLVDMLTECPGGITSAQALVDMLPRLAPRLYSISSSPRAHIGEVHATVAVVRYRSHNRERGGVCSTLFADRIEVNGTLPVYIQQNKKFRLPADSATAIIMIGPGTGIAPFRGFLHERRATAAPGKNWLFFGERSAATDFLYRDELEQMSHSGLLTHLDTAFSRDQDHKIYVQDRMIEQGAELYSWLQQGASVYVCGDATYMAKDVDAALHKVIEQHGACDPEAAKEYVQQMHDDRRYLRDVY